MKKLLVIAAASCFSFISCSKVEPTPAPQQSDVSQDKISPNRPAPPSPQQYVITNTETDWGVVKYSLEYVDVHGEVHIVPLSMGESITLCLIGPTSISTNFAYTIKAIGDC